MIKCARCTADFSKAEAGDTAFIAAYQAAGHPFLCDSCVENAIKGESQLCGDHLTTIRECGCKL